MAGNSPASGAGFLSRCAARFCSAQVASDTATVTHVSVDSSLVVQVWITLWSLEITQARQYSSMTRSPVAADRDIGKAIAGREWLRSAIAPRGFDSVSKPGMRDNGLICSVLLMRRQQSKYPTLAPATVPRSGYARARQNQHTAHFNISPLATGTNAGVRASAPVKRLLHASCPASAGISRAALLFSTHQHSRSAIAIFRGWQA
jgi:hypothetical protein